MFTLSMVPLPSAERYTSSCPYSLTTSNPGVPSGGTSGIFLTVLVPAAICVLITSDKMTFGRVM